MPTNQHHVVKQKNTPSTTQKNGPREISDTNDLKKKHQGKNNEHTPSTEKLRGRFLPTKKAPTKNKKNTDALSPLENSGRHGRNPSIGCMVKEPKRVPPWRNSVTTRRFIEKKRWRSVEMEETWFGENRHQRAGYILITSRYTPVICNNVVLP